MIINRCGAIFEHNGAKYVVGGRIVGTNQSEYEGLFGTITEIRDGEDKETENETPDIYCSFDPPVLPTEVKRLDGVFSSLYDMPKTMDDIILDCVIMAPEMVLPLSDPESDPQQKVYLVEEDWAIDSECGHSIALFADYIGAKQQLNKALAVEMEEGCIAQWENYNDFQCESDDNYYECWLDGFYCENHYEICLREEKIHPPVSAYSNINSKG